MPRGESQKISDNQLLLEILLADSPAVFASEISEHVDLTRQQVGNRLKELEEETEVPLVVSKTASGRRIWWLTTEGRKQVVRFARQRLSTSSGTQ